MSIIKELHVNNVLRIKAVNVTPSGPVVVIGGQNAQGKSSVLDSIAMALGGTKQIPEKPIRNGEERGQIILKTEDLVIERRFTASGSTLVVRNADDLSVKKSPQALLDSLLGQISFDPLAFTAAKPADQLATLKNIVGLDFTAEDAERKKIYDERTFVNREYERAKADLARIPFYPDAPKEEVSVAELMKDLEKAQAVNAKNMANRKNLQGAYEYVNGLKLAIEDLEKRLAFQKNEYDLAAKGLIIQEKNVSTQVEADERSIRDAIANSEANNARIRANVKHHEAQAAITAKKEESDKLTAKIVSIDKSKEEKLSAASFPVSGLGFDENGVTYNGIPFSQASQAEKIRVSVAMGLALNPKLPVLLIREGSLLDTANMKLLANLAAERGAQIWLERVGKEGDVVIEDGMVKAEITEEDI